ncbi:MAG: aminotransferase class I/II-fold pyridoxal phosphate-dependent enzyme [Bacteroidota bacterium]
MSTPQQGPASLSARDPQWTAGNPPHQLPLYAASSFTFNSIEEGIAIFDGEQAGNIYSRFGNPTVDAVADKIARLEGRGLEGETYGLLTSSGMSAISLLGLGLLKPGDKLLTQADLYGGTVALFRDVLAPFGVEVLVRDLRDQDGLVALLEQEESIRCIYCETPSNPILRCVDLEQIAALGKAYNCYTIVDNTFATPILQQPLAHGIDFVIHSTTKYLNGHGTGTAGVVVSQHQELMTSDLINKLRLLGGTASPWEAWLLHNGMKTLALRMERHCQNAQIVAEMLQALPNVQHVNYLGLLDHPDYDLAQRQMQGPGGMISFELEGGLEAGKQFMNRLKFCTLTPTLGDVDTLILHPATMSHRALDPEVRRAHGISDGLIRISVGIEDVADILQDLEQAIG